MTEGGDSVLFVLKGYPRLSETFIAQEIRTLEKRGMAIRILALRRPTDGRTHPVHAEIVAPVAYLPEYLHDEPWRVLKGLAASVRLPGFGRALRAFLRDLPREPSRNRLRRFGQAAVLAAELPPGVTRLHAHFIHTPASVTRYASLLTGLPWTCSAHAKDIWTSPDWDLADKLGEAGWTVTCTRAGAERLAALSPDPGRVRLSYHGLDLSRFPAMTLPRPLRDGSDPDNAVQLLTVARAVEKKGLDVLIDALALLPRDLAWRWTHVGGGGLAEALRERAVKAGVGPRCAFLGARDQTQVLSLYRASDLFVLPCRIAGDGDRDGLPNVLVEAASQGLASVASDVAGVPELIEDDVNGRLCRPDDPAGLAAAIEALARDPAGRWRLGKAAMERVRASFDHERTVDDLWRLFHPEADGADMRTTGGEAA